jgi:hypothetical protein
MDNKNGRKRHSCNTTWNESKIWISRRGNSNRITEGRDKQRTLMKKIFREEVQEEDSQEQKERTKGWVERDNDKMVFNLWCVMLY